MGLGRMLVRRLGMGVGFLGVIGRGRVIALPVVLCSGFMRLRRFLVVFGCC